RAGMRAHGAELRWVGVRRPHVEEWLAEPKWESERATGELVGPETDDEAVLARALVEHLQARGYRAVFANVLMDRLEMNVVRYLDRSLRRFIVVHSITPATYAAARALRDYVDCAVGVSPRVRDDLVARGFPTDAAVAI